MEYEFYLINAFTDSHFSGNGAGVCLIKTQQGEISDALKQKLAAEINLSETAFVTSYAQTTNFQTEVRFGLRWFTPETEVPLCGHATLAAAAAIFFHNGNRNERIIFETLSGPLTVEKAEGNQEIRMKFPWRDNIPLSPEDESLVQLGKVICGSLAINEIRMSPEAKMALIRLDDNINKADFEALKPTAEEMLNALGRSKSLIAVIVTLKASATNGCVDKHGVPYDFVSRVFAPWVGILEDPVTGSAHNVLGPYWSQQLNKNTLYACQGSKRKGELRLLMSGNSSVQISGKHFTYLKGTIKAQ